jgi:hypothetical protein
MVPMAVSGGWRHRQLDDTGNVGYVFMRGYPLAIRRRVQRLEARD